METRDIVREWEEKTMLQGEARALLHVLSKRKLSVSSEQKERITACLEEEKLELWLERALTAESTEDVLR